MVSVGARPECHALPSQVRLRVGEWDYWQVGFENRHAASDAADVHGPDSSYLLIQRQFEDPDGGEGYLETHEEGYICRVRLRSIRGVHRPERVVVAACFYVVQRLVDVRQWEIARRYVARIDDAALHQLQ